MHNSVARTEPLKTYLHRPYDDSLPLAIGANFHDDPIHRNTLRKSHNLQLPQKVEYAPHTQYTYNGLPQSHQYDRVDEALTADTFTKSGEIGFNGWASEIITKEEMEDFVVCMLAYFTERVHESPVEEERLRKVCIRYYVRDQSIAIEEAKQENSGIVQSTILSRRQVPKRCTDPTDIVQLHEFRIGQPISIYGRSYVIVDMSGRSRRYFREVYGEEIPPAIPWPADVYETRIKENLVRSGRRHMTSDDMDRKRALEQGLTGIYTVHSREDIAIARQFFQSPINKHLTFFALWDDRGSLSGDLHYCVIRLYLENCAIEIVEARPENSGREGGAVLVNRQRVPKPGVKWESTRYQQHTFGKLLKSDYLCPTDLQIGETYIIFGKPFYVYSCDDATRQYLRETHKIELRPAIDIKPFAADERKKIIFYPPPPNGFGSERECRSNWLSLSGKPAGLDQERIQREAGRTMTFSARLAKPLTKGDVNREFLISFDRETGELEIKEGSVRNSGFSGGRFLAKGTHRKTLPNGESAPFTAEDFAVGREVVVFERPFLLLGMDVATKRIMDGTDEPLNEERIKSLVILLKQQLNLKFKRANEAYRTLAPQGVLGYQQIKQFLRSCSCDITDEEALLLIENVSPGSNGVMTYEDFLHIINSYAETMDEASLTTRSMRSVNMQIDNTFKTAASASESIHRRKQLTAVLKEKLNQRKGSMQELFRLLSNHNPTSRMHRDAFRSSLDAVLQFNMCADDEDVLVSILFDSFEDADGNITYNQFQEFVDAPPGQ